jgi:Icc-related predicted phosphoesterase
MATSQVRTRVLIISDTHLARLEETGANGRILPFQKSLPAADVLIHCGDLTRSGTLDEFRTALELLREIDAPMKLVIAGNHDLLLDREYLRAHRHHYDLDHEQAEEVWRQARFFWSAPDGPAAEAGVTFLDEGHHEIHLPNGARLLVYASPYTPAFCDFGFAYEKHEDRFNNSSLLPQIGSSIAVHPVKPFLTTAKPTDIMITHGPPYLRRDCTIRGQHVGCPHLLRAVEHTRPLIHCFGHIHEAAGAEIVEWPAPGNELPAPSEALVLDAWRRGTLGEELAALSKALTTRATVEVFNRSHAVEVDINQGSAHCIRRGQDTLMVNAAIMNAHNRPENPPCKQEPATSKVFIDADCELCLGLIHVDLPKAL